MCFSPYDTLPFFNPWKSRFDAVSTDSIILFSKPCSPPNSLLQEIAQSATSSPSQDWGHLQILPSFTHRYNASPVIYIYLILSKCIYFFPSPLFTVGQMDSTLPTQMHSQLSNCILLKSTQHIATDFNSNCIIGTFASLFIGTLALCEVTNHSL